MHVVQIILPILPYVELRAFVKSPRTRIQTNEKRGLTNAGKRQHVRDEAIVREKSVSVAAAGRGRLSSSSFCVLLASVRPPVPSRCVRRRSRSDAGRSVGRSARASDPSSFLGGRKRRSVAAAVSLPLLFRPPKIFAPREKKRRRWLERHKRRFSSSLDLDLSPGQAAE